MNAKHSPAIPTPEPPAVSETASAALRLWVALNRAASAVERHTEADIERHGLAPAEFAALEALRHVGPLLLGDLQRKVLRSSGGTTYVVDRLEGKGLVARRRCPDDRRAVWAEITPEGRALIDRVFPLHAAVVEAATAGLDPAERETVTELLKKLGRAAAERPLPERGHDRPTTGAMKGDIR